VPRFLNLKIPKLKENIVDTSYILNLKKL